MNFTVDMSDSSQQVGNIVNKQITGDVCWSKIDPDGNRLPGSTWTLTKPDSTSIDVEDCVADRARQCAKKVDKDHRAGKFHVKGLEWGKYQLKEKTAPVGYLLDPTIHEFTIKGDKLVVCVGAMKNQQVNVPPIPITGGTSTLTYVSAGSGLLLVALLVLARKWRSKE